MLFVPSLDHETLRNVNALLNTETSPPSYANLLKAVNDRLVILENPEGVLNKATLSRRALAREAVQAIVEPHVLQWMDDDDSLTDVDFIRRALDEINRRFEEQPVWNTTPGALEGLAKKLGDLPCLLFHAKDKCEPDANTTRLGVPFIAVYLKVAFRILECDQSRKIHPRVSAAVYDALAKSFRHQTSIGDDRLYEDLGGFVSRGMKDKERAVRLAAGRALVELVRLFERLEEKREITVVGLFERVNPLLRHPEHRVRETTIVTVGFIGKSCTGPALRESVCSLVFQIGQSNPILKGTATLQLQALARQYKKSLYSLTSPYLDRIAPYLVRRMISEPDGIAEFCRLLSVTLEDFVNLTLKHSLPPLFADGQAKVLEAVAAIVRKHNIALLVLDGAHWILSHSFMLTGIGQTNRGLQFILGVLRENAQDPTAIDIASVARSCLINLLGEIVVCLGDENPDTVEAAHQGLRKLVRLLGAPGSEASGTRQEIEAFFKEHMLGVISTLNDMLQEVHGRQSIETKQKILRSLGEFAKLVGPTIANVAPQIMASLQTMVVVPQFSEAALSSWCSFISTLNPADIGSHVGPTSASLVASWPSFSENGRELARECLRFMIVERGAALGSRLAEVADLSSVPELHALSKHLAESRKYWSPSERLSILLERLDSDSLTVAVRSAIELKAWLLGGGEDHVRSLTNGDVFDPLAGHLVFALYRAACRDGDGTEALHTLAFECIGIVGAIDPDRFELRVQDNRMIMTSNFADEGEAMTFALHLIQDLLVGAFRSTSDIKYQSYLGYAIQELLRFCKFTPALVNPGSGSGSIPMKVRHRWNSLPKTVLETVTPLLESRFNLTYSRIVLQAYPIYPNHSTYRQWVQAWTSDLIYKVKHDVAKRIFQVFTPVVRNKDVGVAHHLLPHLVLTVLASGDEDATQAIRTELLSVLADQVDVNSSSTPDKKLLSAQTVFMLLDHLSKWIRIVRQDIAKQKAEAKRSSRTSSASGSLTNPDIEEALLRVDSVLASVDQGLMAKAAFQCKAYARSLMNLEQQIMTLRERHTSAPELQDHYERLHEMYAHLNEPDGMEGVSTMILSPSLEHQIRQHESTGRWTSAQSCWEVRLQHEPENLDYHLGLLRCLRNLGHYGITFTDSLRTHVKGVLIRNPEWGPQLVGYQVESEWMVGHWEEVQNLVSQTDARPPLVLMAHVLLAMRSGNEAAIAGSLSAAREALGASITASGPTGYRRSYDAVLDLHLIHELEVINQVLRDQSGEVPAAIRIVNWSFESLLQRLATRFDSTLPSFRIREPILNMRRTAFNLSVSQVEEAKQATGKLWLDSAKIARKAGHSQTAYSAILQAQRCNTPFSFIESARLVRMRGEPLRALQELENAMKLLGNEAHEPSPDNEVIDLTEAAPPVRLFPGETKALRAKAHILQARWMADSDRYEDSKVHKEFLVGAEMLPKWESGQFHLGQFHDECFKALSPTDKRNRGMKMNLQTVRCFTRAIRYGSKYIYQTLPRVLTIWLDMAEDPERAANDIFSKINAEVSRTIKLAPVYKWYTAFPQIVSRIGMRNERAYEVLAYLLSYVIAEYPRQALWLFTAVAKSTTPQRATRSKQILSKLRNQNRNNTGSMVTAMAKMTDELLKFCHKPPKEAKVLNMLKDFPALKKMIDNTAAAKEILIPLQESLTANLPPLSASESTHQPFPIDAPTFASFFDEVEVMTSLAKPKKMSIMGSNGQVYTFLGKKDDLRKDGRLMDFNAILNKLLRKDSASRRRQLNIRTYGVVSLNEECGLIQWVPNTVPVRPILQTLYARRGRQLWGNDVKVAFDKMKLKNNREAAAIFTEEVLSLFPPVLHEWFVETFSEPSVWLASRTAYSRTAAVMSMVGYILGLGDRHCENILLDTNCGDVIHVDFDCLFEKGQALETPEIVPFRLTHNIVDGFGVTGVEGFFRISCEVTLRLLRENKDCLMNVLDAFVHDPLVEWEEKRRRLERNHAVADMRAVSQDALGPIEEKLQGVFRLLKSSPGKQLSVNNHVQALIHQATDPGNLARMYVGWAPFQ
ncbi:hypothetical protein BD309DRAFT_856414 [Dichomitus squalens]|uniref:non-specific serine/threonine protein kinase n=1 Tax=Dichomitus squalens TaxID=114155 RepID=A0A4Q9P3R4_9APHY|nr:hypothetical protein BD309DRAFT_856414 [Dichomitus squalens]TBU63193.1 hypothetical protein BD310DRAFT_945218 [Dichomitus squalens]